METYCLYCFKPFTAKRSTAKYCNDSCKTLDCRFRKAKEKAEADRKVKEEELEKQKEIEKQEKKVRAAARKLQRENEDLEKKSAISSIIGSLAANAEQREKAMAENPEPDNNINSSEPQSVVAAPSEQKPIITKPAFDREEAERNFHRIIKEDQEKKRRKQMEENLMAIIKSLFTI